MSWLASPTMTKMTYMPCSPTNLPSLLCSGPTVIAVTWPCQFSFCPSELTMMYHIRSPEGDSATMKYSGHVAIYWR